MDYATLEARLERIEAVCAELAPVVARPFDAYADDPQLQAATERWVHAGLHSAVNAASVVVVGRKWGLPASARDAFEALAERQVLNAELAVRLKRAMDLRDQLAHDDLALTPARLHVQLEPIRRDLQAFHDQLDGWLTDQTQ